MDKFLLLILCHLHLFVCVQPAIGKNEDSVAYKIFKYFKETIKSEMECCKGDTTKVNSAYAHPYTFDFTDETDKPTIDQIMVIQNAALWEWSKENFDNINLIKRILSKNVPDDWEPDYVKFDSFAQSGSYATGVYPDCVDWSAMEPDTVATMVQFNYDIYDTSLWGETRNRNTNYDKLSITTTFEYSIKNIDSNSDGDFKDADDYQILIITPHISVCRDK